MPFRETIFRNKEERSMKKLLSALIMLSLVMAVGCKKKDDDKKDADKPVIKKYARYKVAVYKDKELKDWLATLEKAESVQLMGEEKYINLKKMQIDLATVRLSDNKEGFVDARHLADKPIVFIEDDVKVFLRPDMGSKVHATLPKGTIGFIVDEKAEWVKIYVGKIGAKFVSDQWVKGGYKTDEQLVQDAKEYEMALNLLAENKEEAKKDAKEKLEQIAKGSSEIAGLAKKKLDEVSGAPPQEGMGMPPEEEKKKE